MKTRSMVTVLMLGIVTLALATPVLAGNESGFGAAKQNVRQGQGIQQRLRDGSCVDSSRQLSQPRQRDRLHQKDRTCQRGRFRDGSCVR